MDAINLPTTPNFKTTYICSDHFDNKSFNYFDEFGRSRKRLRAEAVPEINLNPYYLSTENVAKEPVTERVVLVSNINKLENNILKEKNLELNKDDKETEICGEKMPANSLDKGSLNDQVGSYEPNNSIVSNDSNIKKR